SSVLFDRENPHNPINRRISIIVMTKSAEARALSSDAPDVEAARRQIETADASITTELAADARLLAAQDAATEANALLQPGSAEPTAPQAVEMPATPAGRVRHAAAAAEAALAAAGIPVAAEP